MTNLHKLFWNSRCSIFHSRNFKTPELVRSCSRHSKLPKKFDESYLREIEENKSLTFKRSQLPSPGVKYWNEARALKKSVKQNTYPRNVDNIIDLTNGLVAFRKNFPGTFTGILYWIQRLMEDRDLIRQKFLPERHAILRPDLAAAHFLVRRGGSVKFLGQSHWVGIREKNVKLPNTFVPGMYLEAINLEGSNLFYEGLENITDLIYLKSLSLKNLESANDWWLDWISSQYYLNLKHLDLTNCKNVTYRGLSCLYRFENLETLNVEGVPDTPEFKLACVMLQDIMPKLDILGIDLTIPKEIKAVVVEQNEMPKANAV